MSPGGSFTDRENDVISLVGQCKTAREIAYELELSHRTVETYILRIARRIPGPEPPKIRILLHARGLDE